MQFPNAYAGVKKIFTAEILSLIAGVCLIIGSIVGVVVIALASAAASDPNAAASAVVSGLITLVFTLAASVLGIIALILTLVGLKRAGLDEDEFNKGFIFAVCALVLTVVSAIVSSIWGTTIADEIVSAVTRIMQMLVTLFVINGISNLADKLGETQIAAGSKKFYGFYAFLMCVSIVLGIVGPLVGIGSVASIATGIIAMVSSIAMFVAYIIYLVYLGKAKKMLARH